MEKHNDWQLSLAKRLDVTRLYHQLNLSCDSITMTAFEIN